MPDLPSRLMALLFATAEPVTLEALAAAAEVMPPEARDALIGLGRRLDHDGSLRLTCHGDRYALATTPTMAASVARLIGQSSRADLSRPALETLAIIAYRGPVSLGEIEELRGVGSEPMVRNLLARDLVAEHGQRSGPSRARTYVVTHGFLHVIGLGSLSELPPLPQTAGPSGPGTVDEA